MDNIDLHPPTHSKIRNIPIVIKSSSASSRQQYPPISLKVASDEAAKIGLPKSAFLLSPKKQQQYPPAVAAKENFNNSFSKIPINKNSENNFLPKNQQQPQQPQKRLKPNDSWFTTPAPELKILKLNFTPAAKGVILGQTQHPQSVARIEELEAPKLKPEDAPEADKQV
uniref:Uncharacterized protein n=1 Tax=Panagrolaimus sp. ES5 TaxID=591445 RepID=A0AC34FV34_9BILA